MRTIEIPQDTAGRKEYRAIPAAGALPGELVMLGRRGVPMRVIDLPKDPAILRLFERQRAEV